MTMPPATAGSGHVENGQKAIDRLSPGQKARMVIRALRQRTPRRPGNDGQGGPELRGAVSDTDLLRQVVEEFRTRIANCDDTPRRKRATDPAPVAGCDGVSAHDLARCLQAEHPCCAALILSSQPAERARSVLSCLPRIQARRVGLALVQLNNDRWRPSAKSREDVSRTARAIWDLVAGTVGSPSQR